MLDIAFSEMVVIGLVALVVIGPEKLPKVARTVGILLGRAQRYVSDVKTDISRQIQLEELKKLQEELATKAHELENSMMKEMRETEAALTQSAQSLTASGEEAAKDIRDASQANSASTAASGSDSDSAPAQLATPDEELYRGEPPPPKS